MDHQSLLHSLESLLDVNPLKNYTFLFSNLGASHLDSFTSTGRKPFPRESLLRAIIFKNLKGLPSLTELVTELKDNPSAAIRCGFNILRPLPSVERFSSFLKNTHNKDLQKIRLQLIHNLIDLAVITGEYLSIDSCPILKYVVKDLKAKPRISRNPRNTQNLSNIQFSKSGNPICQAQLEMLARGSFYDNKQDRWRRKWVCPLHHSKKIARQYLLCPAFHPKFLSQKGCYVYVRVDQDIRSEIDYGSTSFKSDSKLRSGSERVFSRLLSICMQNPPVISFKAISNYVTIAHITVLLVALTAAKSDMKDKVRFIKSFLPSFKP